MNCNFYQSSPTLLICKTCGKRLPMIPNWKSAKVTCNGPRAMPGVIQQARNFAGSVAGFVADGMAIATKEQQAERLSICQGCDQLDEASGRCFKCGCQTMLKRKARAEQCPLGKWPDLRTTEETEQKQRTAIDPFSGPVTRNLIMFIHPVKGPRNQVAEWRRNLHQIFQRIDLFNGQRVFAVATDAGTDSLETVEAELQAHRCEVLHFANHRELGEVVAFQRLLERVQSDDVNAMTYYCHAKGVTKQHTSQIASIRRWTDAMHEVCLDGVDDVEAVLNNKMFAGAFRAVGAQFPSGELVAHNWHYPGTFFWFRNRSIFSSDRWSKISQTYWGSEAWPGTQCPMSLTACLLMDRVSLASLYSPETWTMTAQPALDRWRKKRLARV